MGRRYWSAIAIVCSAALAALVGCPSDKRVHCGNLLCPAGLTCSPMKNLCVAPDQVAACASLAAGDACGGSGFCYDGACVTNIGLCGDGFVDPSHGEFCDCGGSDLRSTAPDDTQLCGSALNALDPGVKCRPDCTLARCGDGVVDPSELCDDGNTAPFDGCRADCQGRFTAMQTPTTADLTDVLTTGPGIAWAVGENGTVLHYKQGIWKVVKPNDQVTWDMMAIAATGGDVLCCSPQEQRFQELGDLPFRE